MSIVLDGKEYLSAREAEDAFGKTADYVTKICRRGVVHCRLVGNAWMVDRASLQNHLEGVEASKALRFAELSKRLKEERNAKELLPTGSNLVPTLLHVAGTSAVFVSGLALAAVVGYGFVSAPQGTFENKNAASVISSGFDIFHSFIGALADLFPQPVIVEAPLYIPSSKISPFSATGNAQIVQRTGTTTITNVYNQYVTQTGVSAQTLAEALQVLQNKLTGQIANITSSVSGNTQAIQYMNAPSSNYSQVNVNGSQITGGSISGASASLTSLAVSGNTSLGDTTIASTTIANLTLGITGLVQCLHVDANGVITGTGSDCGAGSGGTLTEQNWNFFNGSGVRLGTTTNEVVIGASATSTNDTFQVAGTANISGALTLGTWNGPLQANNGTVSATTSVGTLYGGTGLTAYATGDILYADSANHLTTLPVGGTGTVLKIAGGVPTWGVDLSSGGGAGAWATTTSQVAAQLINYSGNTSDIVAIGGSSTTSAKYWFDPNSQIASFSGKVGIGTTSPYAKLGVSGFSSGAGIVADALPGFTGNLLDLKLASSTKFSVDQGGNTTVGGNLDIGTNGLVFGGWYLNSSNYPGTGGFVYGPGGNLTFGVSSSGGGTGSQASFQIDGAFIQGEDGKTNTYAGPSQFNNTITATGLATLSNASTTLLSSTYASSTRAFLGSLSVANLSGIVKATAGSIGTGLVNLTSDITGTLPISSGGTGSTSFSYGLVLSPGGTSAFQNIATSSLGLLTTNVAEGSNLYYTDTRVNTYVDASTTIPKTYTANTFTNANTFSSTTATSTFQGGLSAGNNAALVVNQTALANALVINSAGDLSLGAATAYASLGGTPDLSVAGIINANNAIMQAGGTVSNPGYQFYSSSNTGLFNTGSNSTSGIGFSVQGVEKGRFSSAGNFGVGTTSPLARLDVAGANNGTAPLLQVSSVSNFATTTNLSVSGTGFGTTTVTGLNINASATTTSNVGFNTTAGCYAIGGNCLSLATIAGTLAVAHGGTGISSTPAYGQLLVGNGTNYTLTATSSLGIALADVVTGFTQGSVVFAGSSGTLTEDNSNFFYNPSNHTFRAGGTGNTISDSNAAVIGGSSNTINSGGTYAFIGGGSSNQTASTESAITGGDTNFIDVGSDFAAITGGNNNIINTGAYQSFIGAGTSNTISDYESAITGGFSNSLNSGGRYSAIAGGRGNQSSDQYTFLGGGRNNSVNSGGSYSSISGGQSNQISDSESGILGGDSNTIASGGTYSAISGGYGNTVSAFRAAISGGWSNSINSTGYISAIVGGGNNQINDSESAIVGGGYNAIRSGANDSFIGGGNANQTYAYYSFIAAGDNNTIASGANASFIAGDVNETSGSYALVSGSHNSVDSDYSSIVGGAHNTVNASHTRAFIGGGDSNQTTGTESFIGAGDSNTIASGGDYSFIAAGGNNTASDQYAFLSGSHNTINTGGSYSSVIGGTSNQISDTESGIVGGNTNTIASGASDAFIGGGRHNTAGYGDSFIGGGYNNQTSDASAAVVGGISNSANSMHSFIGGGETNTANGVDSFIGAGSSNTIGDDYAFIGGGSSNTVNFGGANSFIAGGQSNQTGGPYAFAAGYTNNASGSYSTVFGRNTTVSGTGSFGIGLDGSSYTVSQNNTFAVLGGNVGIGTTSPSDTLDVAGNIRASVDQQYKGFNLLRTDTQDSYSITADGTGSAAGLEFWTYPSGSAFSGGTPRMTMLASGNIGIGTTTPHAKLSVKGADTTTGVNFQTTDSNDIPLLSAFDNGSVAIGNNAAPTALFDVSRTAGLTGVGTVTTTAGGTTVTGSGTVFTQIFQRGDTITIGAETEYITTVNSDTTLTTATWTNAFTAQPFTVPKGGERFQIFPNGGIIIGDTVTTQTSGTLTVGRNLTDGGTSNYSTMILGSSMANTLAANPGQVIGLQVAPNVGAANTQNWTGVGLVGIFSAPVIKAGATGTISNVYEFYTNANTSNHGNLASGATVTNWYGARFSAIGATGPVTNYIGAAFDRNTTATNNTALYLASAAATAPPTGNYSIYNANTDKNYFAGNVGIGSTTPTVDPLLIQSIAGARAIGLIGRSSDDSSNIVYYKNSGSLYNSLTVDPTNGFQFGTTTSVIFKPNGNVGIGTTSPAGLLSVGGNLFVGASTAGGTNGKIGIGTNVLDSDTMMTINRSSLTSGIAFENAGTQAAYIGVDVTAGNLISGSASNDFIFRTNGSGNMLFSTGGSSAQKMRIDSTGNVVVGNTSPATTNGSNALVSFFGASKTNSNEVGTLALVSSDAQAADAGGSLSFQGKYNSGGAYATFGRVYGNKTNSTSGDFSGYLGFAVTNSGSPAEAMRIISNGNIGIGTTTPGAPLEVYKNQSGPDLTGGGIILSRLDGTSYRGGAIYSRYISGTATDDLVFGVTTVDGKNPYSDFDQARMVINSSGNVGIGTTSPMRTLSVSASNPEFVLAGSSAGADAFHLGVDDMSFNRNIDTGAMYSANAYGYQWHRVDSTTNTTDNLQLQVYSNTGSQITQNALAINGLGNVGIGTANPGVTGLQIGNSAVGSGYYSATLGLGVDSALQKIMAKNDSGTDTGLAFFTTNGGGAAATERLRINGLGNVGIGTTTPSFKLSVETTHTPSSCTATSGITATTCGSLDVFNNGTNTLDDGAFLTFSTNYSLTRTSRAAIKGGTEVSGANGSGYLAFFTNVSGSADSLTERMRITSTGALLVGTVTSRGGPATFFTGSGTGVAIESNNIANSNFAQFQYGTTVIGSIARNSSSDAVLYNTTSDRRVKENIATTTAGLSTLLQIPVDDFNYISDINKTRQQGFIAQDIYAIYPEAVSTNGDNGLIALNASSTPWAVDYGRLTPLLVKSIQDLNLKIEDIATTTPTGELDSNSFVGRFFSGMFSRIAMWLGDTSNNLAAIFVGTIHAKDTICVDDQCLTKDDVRALLALAHQQTGYSTPPSNTPPADTEAPVITLNGDSSLTVPVGSTYSDPGATVSDNVDTNLGFKVSLDGGDPIDLSALVLDTSTTTTHSIVFSATDQAGNTGTATRVVEIQ